MGNFLKPLLKISINRISWITCSDASTLFDYSIVDPGFTQGTANLSLGGGKGEKCSLFHPVNAVKSHYRAFAPPWFLINWGWGCGAGFSSVFFFFFLNSKNTAFKSAQHQARMTRFFRRAHHSFEQLKWWGLQEGIGGERQPWWLSLGAAGCSACCFCIFLWYSSIGRLFLTSSPGKTSPSFLSAQRRLWAPVRLLNLGAYRMMMENISHIK